MFVCFFFPKIWKNAEGGGVEGGQVESVPGGWKAEEQMERSSAEEAEEETDQRTKKLIF